MGVSMKFVFRGVLLCFVIVSFFGDFGYSKGFYVDLGMPFYKDGTGLLGEVSFKLGISDFSEVLLPIFVKGGLGFQYARGSDGVRVVDYMDFGMIAGGEYVLETGDFGFSFALDFYFSYGSKFTDLGNLGSLGVNLRPILGVIYKPREKLSFRLNLGYNAGLYSFYLGHIKVGIGADLKL